MEKIKKEIIKLLHRAGITGDIVLSAPPNPAMGDFAFACFEIARQVKKNPVQLAEEIAESIRANGRVGEKNIIAEIKTAGPYINFYLNVRVLSAEILGEIKKHGHKYGFNKTGNGQQVILEYPSNNTHKEVHIGHLRNICIGNSLMRIYEASGYRAVPVNYVNDFGLHVAKCLWGLMKFHQGEKPPRNKQKWLGQIYAEAGNYLLDHKETEQEVRDLQLKIEKKDKEITKLLNETRQWSLDGFSQIFSELSLHHRTIFFESKLKAEGQKMVDKLLKKKIAKKGEGGAIIVDLEKYGLDVALLRKSDGAGLYMTSDLALAVEKNKKFPKAVENISITGSEQDFYFKQLFKILALAGFKFKTKHIGYGLVNLPSGKMSSRTGNVVLYEQVRDVVLEKLIKETKEKHPDWPESKINKTAKILAFAAIKFDFLKHEASKVVYFDEESAASFEGFTGPYVLYAVARINSLLKKAKKIKFNKPADLSLLATAEEKLTVLLLANYPEVILKALENYNPSVITKYCFDLAKQFSDFYNKQSVLSAGSKELAQSRLVLSDAVRQVLISALSLLTIDFVVEM